MDLGRLLGFFVWQPVRGRWGTENPGRPDPELVQE